MNQPHHILLPVNRLFIAASLSVAFLLNLLPWGRTLPMPDFVALVLIFWSMHQPRNVGMGVAFIMGLFMDVHDAVLLGENALAYTLLSYVATTIHRRVLWFTPRMQALHILPLLLMMQTIRVVIHMWANGTFPGWTYFMISFISILLWPGITWVLLAPQRRSVDTDMTRPI